MATSASLPRDVFSPQMHRLGPRLQRGPGRGTRKAPGAGAETRPGGDGGALCASPHPTARRGLEGFQRGGRELRPFKGADGAGRRRLWGANTGFLEKAPTEPRPHSGSSKRD